MIIYRENNLILTEKLKIFSESYEQKEFGILSDIKHSGIKRVTKRNLGKFRKSLAEKLDKSIVSGIKENDKIVSNSFLQHRNLPHGEITEQERLLVNSRNNTASKWHEETDHYKTKNLKNNKELLNLSDGKENLITLKYNASPGELYHELGHVKNSTGENGVKAKIINKSISKKAINELDKAASITERGLYEKSNPALKEKGIIKSIKNKINGKIRIKEEQNASNSGLKDLKRRSILSNKEFELEKQNQKLANQTYKNAVNTSTKIPLRNSIQIPSKRGEFTYHD